MILTWPTGSRSRPRISKMVRTGTTRSICGTSTPRRSNPTKWELYDIKVRVGHVREMVGGDRALAVADRRPGFRAGPGLGADQDRRCRSADRQRGAVRLTDPQGT